MEPTYLDPTWNFAKDRDQNQRPVYLPSWRGRPDGLCKWLPFWVGDCRPTKPARSVMRVPPCRGRAGLAGGTPEGQPCHGPA